VDTGADKSPLSVGRTFLAANNPNRICGRGSDQLGVHRDLELAVENNPGPLTVLFPPTQTYSQKGIIGNDRPDADQNTVGTGPKPVRKLSRQLAGDPL
jgi:hypothetical protein